MFTYSPKVEAGINNACINPSAEFVARYEKHKTLLDSSAAFFALLVVAEPDNEIYFATYVGHRNGATLNELTAAVTAKLSAKIPAAQLLGEVLARVTK